MKRILGLAALVAALSACAAQGPNPTGTQPGNPPFQAVAPAGYCLWDNPGEVISSVQRTIDNTSGSPWLALAAFHPCSEPASAPGVAGGSWHRARLEFRVKPIASDGDRQVFVALMANPKITDLLNQRALPKLRDRVPERLRQDIIIGDLRYLGSDADAVYDGFEVTVRGVPQGPNLTVTSRSVSGQTVIGRYSLSVTAVSLAGNGTPEDWEALRTLVARAIHGTIVEAERPGTAPPAPSPMRPLLPAADGTSLTT